MSRGRGDLGEADANLPLAKLHDYRSAHRQLMEDGTYDHATSLSLTLGPGDNVAQISMKLQIPAGSVGNVEIVRFTDPGGVGAMSVQALTASDEHLLPSIKTTAAGLSLLVTITDVLTVARVLSLDLELFGAGSNFDGLAPFLTSDVRLNAIFPTDPSTPVVLSFTIPRSADPRRMRGNYVHAAPSQTRADDRTNLVYFPKGAVDIDVRIGTSEKLHQPWTSLGGLALASLIVTLVLGAGQAVGAGDAIAVLIAALLGLAPVLWDLARDLSEFSIYGAARSWLQRVVLASQITMVVFTIIVITVIVRYPHLIPTIRFISIPMFVLLTVGSLAGFVALSRGSLHRFGCDAVACDEKIVDRRQCPECHATGRVFCEGHFFDICRSCYWCHPSLASQHNGPESRETALATCTCSIPPSSNTV